ncbi:MAG: ATP-dependent Clp protease ATP-binding subunit [Oscillospiraceae bacterium]|nr:ATP-dependent Clp protease ATP-binding subunit [Oscillospiraceae bacterium]
MRYEDRFTERAKEAIQQAHEFATQLGHGYIGSEHILLGLSKGPGDSAARRILLDYGLATDLLQDLVEKYVGRGEAGQPTQGLTPRAKRIIELAMASAVQLGHRYVSTEHLLMGILREHESVAAKLVVSVGVDLNRMYTDLVNVFGALDMAGAGQSPASAAPRQTNRKETKTLNQFSRDLTDLAAQGRLDPVVGRDKEISRVVQILSRRSKNNPVLIGEPGVGKTAIAEGLAQQIIAGDVPEDLRNKRIVTLDLTGMLAGTKYRGDFEERIRAAMEEVTKAGDIILFIDELHTLIGAGAAEGAIDAANIVKPALGRGEIQIIGATTLEEYRKHIEKDAALERRFQPITVDEPTEEESVRILKGLRDKYEAHHKLKISDEAIEAAVCMSSRYITDRYLPDKAIDLIDEAASRVRMETRTVPRDLKEIEAKIEALRMEKEEAIRGQSFERAALLRDDENVLRAELEAHRRQWEEARGGPGKSVLKEDIAAVVSGWTGIPVTSLTEDESQRLLKMEDTLHQRVVGQDEAVKAVARAIRRGRVGLKDPKRPTGTFLFLGPTGVGKTELCRALAEAVFGDENAMIRVDMSEFMEKHTVSKLIGSPPGYVGYEEGGQLTEKVRRKPYSVILFDEIEKGHEDVWSILLQIMEDGRLTDGQGRRVDFKNTIVVMTSNVGAKNITERKKPLGFSAGEADVDGGPTMEEIRAAVMEDLKKTFRPEFLNRIDETIVFHQLSRAEIGEIAAQMLTGITARLEGLGIHLTVDQSAIERLADRGFDPVYGARPLRRAIQSAVEDGAAEQLLEGKIKPGDTVEAVAEDGEIVLRVKTPAAV